MTAVGCSQEWRTLSLPTVILWVERVTIRPNAWVIIKLRYLVVQGGRNSNIRITLTPSVGGARTLPTVTLWQS